MKKMNHLTIPQLIGEKGIFTDGDWVESKDQDPGGSVRLIQLADIGDGLFLNKSNRRLTKEKALQLRCTFLRKGDILIARMPDPLGRCCIFPKLDDECVTVVDVCIVRISDPNHHPQFISRIINSHELRKQIERQTTGTTRKRISRGNLSKIKIPLPPLDDQKRIAHLLGKVEGLIALRKQHLQQLDDLLKSVFLEMFGHFLKDGSNSTLADCLKIQQGFAFKSSEFIEDGVPIIKIGTVNKGFFDYSTLSFIAKGYPEKIRRYEIIPGDLLISLTGTVGKDDYGNTCFVPNNSIHQKYLLNQRVGKLTCDKKVVNPFFINAFMTLPEVKSALIKQNRGIRQANLSNLDIYKITLSIPPLDLQNQFAAIVEKVEGLKSRYQQSLSDLETLYGALSQKAFKGELDLSGVPLPEEDPTVIIEEVEDQKQEIADMKNIELPTPDANWIITEKKRHAQMGIWFDAYLKQLKTGDAPSLDTFVQLLEDKFYELEGEYAAAGLMKYDQAKEWLFKAIADGRIEQTRNPIEIDGKPELGNQIILKKV